MTKTNSMNFDLIRDTGFDNGFYIHGPKHSDGIIGKIFSFGQTPDWRIAQWGVYKNPITNQIPATKSINVLKKDNGNICLELKSQYEYCGHLRCENEDWPHLLIEQFFDKKTSIGEMSKLIYSCYFKLNYIESSFLKEELDDTLHAAQVHQFLTIEDKNTKEFIWFGIPFFDTRYKIFKEYIGIDLGKADASNSMIYIQNQTQFTNISSHDYERISVNTDILPMIKKAVELAKSKGIFANSSLNDMFITSTNIGWEMFSEHNGSCEIGNLHLTVMCQ